MSKVPTLLLGLLGGSGDVVSRYFRDLYISIITPIKDAL